MHINQPFVTNGKLICTLLLKLSIGHLKKLAYACAAGPPKVNGTSI